MYMGIFSLSFILIELLQAAVTYAIQQLNTVGVYMYLDAGHAGWLGWPANLSPAAQLFNDLYTAAGSPAFVRGLATNVANYNALSYVSYFVHFNTSISIHLQRCDSRPDHFSERQLR